MGSTPHHHHRALPFMTADSKSSTMTSENHLNAAIIVISDTAAKDASTDKCYGALSSVFSEQTNVQWIVSRRIIPDEKDAIQEAVESLCDQESHVKSRLNLIVTTGGTGFATRDVTPEAVEPLLQKKAPGLVHGMLAKSLEVTPFAMMSRPVAGVINGVVIVTLPGSPKGARENLEAIIKLIPHACMQAMGMDSRVLHAGGTKKLEEDSGLSTSSSEKRSSVASVGLHHHHDHSHGHEHGHGHAIPRAHTRPEDRPQSNDPSADPTQRHRESPYPMLSVQDALTTILNQVSDCEGLLKPVKRPVNADLVGYILAEDITAKEAVPAFRASIVDGYAIVVDGTVSSKGVFPVVSVSHASPGDISPLEHGQIARITTGAPLPPGASSVVMVEDTVIKSKTHDGKEEREVEILTDAIKPGENVREVGSDTEAGTTILRRGERLGPGEVGLLASDGRAEITVFSKPIIGILSTGDEIVDHKRAEPLRLGEVRDCNRPAILSLLKSRGHSVSDLGIARDTSSSLENALRDGFRWTDVLITTGGVSMGELDLLKPTLERSLGGTIHFGRVAMKPGKPTTFATVPFKYNNGDRKTKVIFSLPGNPASAITCTNLFVLPFLAKAMGERLEGTFTPGQDEWRQYGLPRAKVFLAESVSCDKTREEYQRAVVLFGKDSRLNAITTGGQRSSRIGSFQSANALLILPAGGGTLEKGTPVEALIMGEIKGGD